MGKMPEISCAPFEEVFIEKQFSDCYRGLATPNIYISVIFNVIIFLTLDIANVLSLYGSVWISLRGDWMPGDASK